MHGSSIIQDLVLLYGLALLVMLIGSRLRAPVIVSLITTGVVAGPGGLGLVGSEETVQLLSEVGVALLLFMVGLDLSFAEVRRLWRSVLVGGSAQMLGTMALVAPLATLAYGTRAETLVFVSFFVAISSTSIVVRELTRRNELHAPHGSLAIGVLLLQDIAALLALVLAPVLFGTTGASLGRALVQIVVIGVGLAGVTRFLLPVLFRMATAAGREAFGLTVLVASLGTAWLASSLGLSMTVGAFLAGLVLDESEFSHQIHAEIRPLRDLLTSLFFISVGLLVHPSLLLPVLPLVVAVAVGIVVVKVLGATMAFLVAGVTRRIAVTTAVGLAQVGEFSFVLGAGAVANGAISVDDWQVLLGASVLTMAASPTMVGLAPLVGAWAADRRETAVATDPTLEARREGHVVILGFGVGGRILAKALGEVDRAHVVLELDGTAVREAGLEGHAILYGDATAAEPLRAAGVEHAAAVVAVLSDPGASERAVRAVRAINPRVPVLVRTRYRTEAERMRRAGASLAVAEELEASLEVLAQLLVRLEVPGNTVEDLVDEARVDLASPTFRGTRSPAVPSAVVSTALGDAPVSSHRLADGEWAIGRDLGALNLRAATGATIVAVRRGSETVAPPPVSWQFAAGDVLYLIGAPATVRLARFHLGRGPGSLPRGVDPSAAGMEQV